MQRCDTFTRRLDLSRSQLVLAEVLTLSVVAPDETILPVCVCAITLIATAELIIRRIVNSTVDSISGMIVFARDSNRKNKAVPADLGFPYTLGTYQQFKNYEQGRIVNKSPKWTDRQTDRHTTATYNSSKFWVLLKVLVGISFKSFSWRYISVTECRSANTLSGSREMLLLIKFLR